MNKNVIYKKNTEEKVIKTRINKHLSSWNFEFKTPTSKKIILIGNLTKFILKFKYHKSNITNLYSSSSCFKVSFSKKSASLILNKTGICSRAGLLVCRNCIQSCTDSLLESLVIHIPYTVPSSCSCTDFLGTNAVCSSSSSGVTKSNNSTG